MRKPRRVQLSRKKGWRMPPNTVRVDRATNWGNPYKDAEPALLVSLYRDFLKSTDSRRAQWVREHIGELRGLNLGCWCPRDQPCHADVLLELANA